MYDEILKIYIRSLNYLNYSKNTIGVYSHYVVKFLESTNKYPQHLVSFDFNEYLMNYKYSSLSQQNQIISAIKFLNILKTPLKFNIIYN